MSRGLGPLARTEYRRRVNALIVVVLSMVVLGGLSVVLGPPAGAQPELRASPSDPRAEFHDGNATSCGDIGFPSSRQVSLNRAATVSDPNVTGTVKKNAGTIQPGTGEEVDIAINPGASIVMDAVTVKGSNGYNVYSNPVDLPPTLLPDQHYISPLNGGGNVPAISHWFVCYHPALPLPTGSLTVYKAVLFPDGVPVAPLPTSYTAAVTCSDTDPAHDTTVTFSEGGGQGTPVVTGLPLGTVCTVVENVPSLPPGTVVGYAPPGADTTGVSITATSGVSVAITNDFTALLVQRGDVQLVKAVVNPSGVALPLTFTAHVLCTDGITDAVVTMPAAGGTGTPILHPKVRSLCGLEELSVPAGWTVTYSVDGSPPSTNLPIFTITSSTQSVTVTITNTAPTTTTTTAPTTTTTTTAPTTTTTGSTTTTTTAPTTTTTTAPTTTTTTGSTTTTTTAPTTTTTTGSTTTTTTAPTTTTGSTTTTTTAPTTTTGSTTTTATAGEEVTASTTGSAVAGESLATTGGNPFHAIRLALIALLAGAVLLVVSLLRSAAPSTAQHRKRTRHD